MGQDCDTGCVMDKNPRNTCFIKIQHNRGDYDLGKDYGYVCCVTLTVEI